MLVCCFFFFFHFFIFFFFVYRARLFWSRNDPAPDSPPFSVLSGTSSFPTSMLYRPTHFSLRALTSLPPSATRVTPLQSLVEAHNPRAAQHLRTLLLQYMWQQITPFTLQATLHDIYSTHPFLHTPSTYDPIRPFLEHEIATPEDEAKTKGLLREAWGTLTQSAPEGVDPVRNWGKDMGVLKDIQVCLG